MLSLVVVCDTDHELHHNVVYVMYQRISIT